MICGGTNAHTHVRRNRRGQEVKKQGQNFAIHHANCNVCMRKVFSPCDPNLQKFVAKFGSKEQKRQSGGSFCCQQTVIASAVSIVNRPIQQFAPITGIAKWR